MATEPTIDIEQLLAAIAGENPSGEALRHDPVLGELKNSRTGRDPTTGEPKEPDWGAIISLATDTLQQRSKHLMVAAHLTEALAEKHGFAGLRDGLGVVNGLMERFWDTVNPAIGEDGDLGARLAPINWLVDPDRGSLLPSRLRNLDILPPPDRDTRFSFVFFQSSFAPARGANESDADHAQRVTKAAEREAAWKSAEVNTPLAHVEALRDAVLAAREQGQRFDALLNEKCRDAAPGTTALREALDDCARLVEKIYAEKAPPDETPIPPGGPDDEPPKGGPREAAGPISSRAQALRQLQQIAAFLRQTEPHSPISYLVQRAVSWGEKSLDQLLEELVRDPTSREQIRDLLGMPKESQ